MHVRSVCSVKSHESVLTFQIPVNIIFKSFLNHDGEESEILLTQRNEQNQLIWEIQYILRVIINE